MAKLTLPIILHIHSYVLLTLKANWNGLDLLEISLEVQKERSLPWQRLVLSAPCSLRSYLPCLLFFLINWQPRWVPLCQVLHVHLLKDLPDILQPQVGQGRARSLWQPLHTRSFAFRSSGCCMDAQMDASHLPFPLAWGIVPLQFPYQVKNWTSPHLPCSDDVLLFSPPPSPWGTWLPAGCPLLQLTAATTFFPKIMPRLWLLSPCPRAATVPGSMITCEF